jgi:hypothetical protein
VLQSVLIWGPSVVVLVYGELAELKSFQRIKGNRAIPSYVEFDEIERLMQRRTK